MSCVVSGVGPDILLTADSERSTLVLMYSVLVHSLSSAVGQAVACAPVTQLARVRSPVGASFLGEVFSGFFLTCKTKVGKL